MRSISVSRNGEKESVFWLTSTDYQQARFCLTLNMSERPRTANPSRLSDILETSPNEKYKLSAKACQGILNRAERRGKELPTELKAALIAQSACKETELTEQIQQDATALDGVGGAATPLTQSTDQPLSVSKNELENLVGAKEYSCRTNEQEPCQRSTTKLFAVPINTMVATRDNEESRTTFGVGEPNDPQFTLSAAHEHAVFSAGFSFGQSEKARSIGYQEEMSPTLRGGDGGNQKPVVMCKNPQDPQSKRVFDPSGVGPTLNSGTTEGMNIVPSVMCGNPWDSQSERVYHGDGAWHSLNANESGGQSRDAVLAFSQNQREEVRELGNCSGSVSAEMGTHQQTFVKAYSFDSLASNSMKSANPHSGCRAVETAKTLDCFDPNPSKNQGGIAVLAVDCRNGIESEINGTLQTKDGGGYSVNLNNVIRTQDDSH